MQQFTGLLIKELKLFFCNSLIYITALLYLLSSVGLAIYFGAYTEAHDAAMYSLFFMQPVLAAIFVPAITMKIWSDEFKTGSAEILLTLPLHTYILVVAKWIAAIIAMFLITLLLLPFIIYTASFLQLDWLNILCAFIGLWLLIFMFCAMGCFISALSKYVMMTYLLSVMSMFACLVISQSGLYDVYNNFLFGEIGFSDVLYFISFAIAFILLNIIQIDNYRSSQGYKNIKLGSFAVLLICGTMVLNIALQRFFSNKYDVTAVEIYTPHAKSKEVINQIKEPITIDVFIAKDYKKSNPDYFRYFNQVTRFLNKYQKLSQGMITVNIAEISAFSEDEKNVLHSGAYYEENIYGTKNYFAAILRDNNGQATVIKQFLAERQAYLEKDINQALLKLVKPELLKSIGVYMDSEQNLDMFQGFLLNLENDYNVVEVTDETYEISPRMDMLIMLNPKRLSPYIKYAADQYMLNGGKTIWFFDIYTDGQSENVNMDVLDFITFLDQWNVELDENMVDEGKAIKPFGQEDSIIKVNKAMRYAVNNSDLTLIPVIQSENKYIAAILKGRLHSIFDGSLYENTEMEKKVSPHMIQSVVESNVAVVADVDIIGNDSWIDDSSPDKNPYSIISKAKNMEVLRNMIDYMIGNKIYLEMPINTASENTYSISQKVAFDMFEKYMPIYKKIIEEIKNKKMLLAQKNSYESDKANIIKQISESGENLAQLEEETEKIMYQMRTVYAQKINELILTNLITIPFFLLLLFFVGSKLQRRRRKKITEGMFHE